MPFYAILPGNGLGLFYNKSARDTHGPLRFMPNIKIMQISEVSNYFTANYCLYGLQNIKTAMANDDNSSQFFNMENVISITEICGK